MSNSRDNKRIMEWVEGLDLSSKYTQTRTNDQSKQAELRCAEWLRHTTRTPVGAHCVSRFGTSEYYTALEQPISEAGTEFVTVLEGWNKELSALSQAAQRGPIQERRPDGVEERSSGASRRTKSMKSYSNRPSQWTGMRHGSHDEMWNISDTLISGPWTRIDPSTNGASQNISNSQRIIRQDFDGHGPVGGRPTRCIHGHQSPSQQDLKKGPVDETHQPGTNPVNPKQVPAVIKRDHAGKLYVERRNQSARVKCSNPNPFSMRLVGCLARHL